MRLVGFFILLVCCWTVSARDMLSLRGPSAQRFRDKRVNNLEIARLIRMIASLNQDAKPTVPLENDQIYQILAQIPQVGNDSICLQSESCAQSWIDYYNYALGKIYEKSAVLEVALYIHSFPHHLTLYLILLVSIRDKHHRGEWKVERRVCAHFQQISSID